MTGLHAKTGHMCSWPNAAAGGRGYLWGAKRPSAAAGEPSVAPRLAQAGPASPPSPQARPAPGGFTRQHRSMSVEPLDQRMDMPMFQSMVQLGLPL